MAKVPVRKEATMPDGDKLGQAIPSNALFVWATTVTRIFVYHEGGVGQRPFPYPILHDDRRKIVIYRLRMQGVIL